MLVPRSEQLVCENVSVPNALVSLQLQFGEEVSATVRPRIRYALRVFAAIYGYRVAEAPESTDVRVFYSEKPPAIAHSKGVWVPARYHAELPKPSALKLTKRQYADENFYFFFGADREAGNPDWLGEIFEWLSCSHERRITQRDSIGRIPYAHSVFAQQRISPRKPHAMLAMAWLQNEIVNPAGGTESLPKPASNGLDQLLFTNRYAIPLLMFCIICAVAFARDVLRTHSFRNWLLLCAIPLELYLLVEAGIQLLPASIYLPQYAAPVGDLTERLTSISAVLLCCLLGAIPPRRWHLFAFSAVAIVFFLFLYQDTGRLARMEARVEFLVHTIPPGQRILLTITQPLNYRFSSKHILDIACPGYCFAYGNYEAPTGQFRLRANPESPIVVADLRDAEAMEQGSYVVQSRVLPLFQIYQCGLAWTDLCIRPLQAGETISSAVHRN